MECPSGHGSVWCNGDCEWNEQLTDGQCIPKDRNQRWDMLGNNQIFQDDISNQALAKLGTSDVGFTQSATTLVVHVGTFDGSQPYKTSPCVRCYGCAVANDNPWKDTFHFGYTDSMVVVWRTDAGINAGWGQDLFLRCYSGAGPAKESQRFIMKMHCVHQEDDTSSGILQAFTWAKNEL
jgi:hypothetical protein